MLLILLFELYLLKTFISKRRTKIDWIGKKEKVEKINASKSKNNYHGYTYRVHCFPSFLLANFHHYKNGTWCKCRNTIEKLILFQKLSCCAHYFQVLYSELYLKSILYSNSKSISRHFYRQKEEQLEKKTFFSKLKLNLDLKIDRIHLYSVNSCFKFQKKITLRRVLILYVSIKAVKIQWK